MKFVFILLMSTGCKPGTESGENCRKQGRIHGNPVTDSWAGAVLRKLLKIQKCNGRTDLPTYRPTRQGRESRVRDYKKVVDQP